MFKAVCCPEVDHWLESNSPPLSDLTALTLQPSWRSMLQPEPGTCWLTSNEVGFKVQIDGHGLQTRRPQPLDLYWSERSKDPTDMWQAKAKH